jgi:hypothetical protein
VPQGHKKTPISVRLGLLLKKVKPVVITLSKSVHLPDMEAYTTFSPFKYGIGIRPFCQIKTVRSIKLWDQYSSRKLKLTPYF